MVRALKEGEVITCPAEDLSADDDLLSWILVDQLGCLPGKGLGVHPQQVKFVGTPFKTSEVLAIVSETVVNTNKHEAKRRLLDFPLIKAHLESKVTEKQREQFINHLVRYTLPYRPDSRIEIYTTDRYKSVTGHGELAVYATRPLPIGTVVKELQGSIVRLPDQWRDEMDLADDFALEPSGDEESEDEPESDDEEQTEVEDERSRQQSTATGSVQNGGPSRKGKRKNEPKGARRSGRTKRRDFSIVWSQKDRCYQLFLGPARFLNHDCNPNVTLLRQGRYVTFRVERPIKIGDEITTFYGHNYFGKENIECLCLTCEILGKGGFTRTTDNGEPFVPEINSPSASTPSKYGSPASSRRPIKPSALRNALSDITVHSAGEEEDPIAGPSGTSHVDLDPITPRKVKPRPSLLSMGGVDSPATDASQSEPASPSESGPPVVRERYQRKAAKNAQHFSFLKRPKKDLVVHEAELLVDEEDEGYERCVTCAKAMREREWFNNRYFDHCLRCIRHSLIFDLPWPAHHSSQVLDYPPSHLIPHGYVAPRVSSIPLPSLDKNRKKHAEPIPTAPEAENVMERKARLHSAADAKEISEHEQLRQAVWTAQETAENQIRAAEQAKEDARRKREDAQRQRDENKVKGTGIWQRYEYIDDEEFKRRQAAKNAITTGTRRGGRFKAADNEEEERRLAEEIEARRQAEASAEETDTDADDEDDGEVLEEEGPDEPYGQGGPDLEMEETKPIISPMRGPNGDGKIPRGVIDLSESTDLGSTGIEDGDEASFNRGAKLKKKRKPHTAMVHEETDSDDIQLSAGKKYTRRAGKESGGVIMPSSPKIPSSPVRRKVKTKPSGKSKPPRTSLNITDIDDIGSSPDGESRGRGRPTGSGKRQKQKAAAARRSSHSVAGPSGTSKHRSSPQKQKESREHIQTLIEKELAALDAEATIHHEFLVEGKGKDGKFVWKSTNVVRSNPYDYLEAATGYIIKEKMEYQAYLAKRNHEIDTHGTARKLPGEQCLISSADVRAWSPSRLEEPDHITLHYTDEFEIPPLPDGARPHHVVGLTFDPEHMTYGRPSLTEGPWRNGEYRMMVAMERPVNDSMDVISAEINEMVGWNDDAVVMTSDIVTPLVDYISESLDTAQGTPPGKSTPKSNDILPPSSATPVKSATRPDIPARKGTPSKQAQKTAVSAGSTPKVSASPAKAASKPRSATITKIAPIASPRPIPPAANGTSAHTAHIPFVNGTVQYLLGSGKVAHRPRGASLSKGPPSAPIPEEPVTNRSVSRLAAMSSKTWPSTAVAMKSPSGNVGHQADTSAIASSPRISATSSEGRPSNVAQTSASPGTSSRHAISGVYGSPSRQLNTASVLRPSNTAPERSPYVILGPAKSSGSASTSRLSATPPQSAPHTNPTKVTSLYAGPAATTVVNGTTSMPKSAEPSPAKAARPFDGILQQRFNSFVSRPSAIPSEPPNGTATATALASSTATSAKATAGNPQQRVNGFAQRPNASLSTSASGPATAILPAGVTSARTIDVIPQQRVNGFTPRPSASPSTSASGPATATAIIPTKVTSASPRSIAKASAPHHSTSPPRIASRPKGSSPKKTVPTIFGRRPVERAGPFPGPTNGYKSPASPVNGFKSRPINVGDQVKAIPADGHVSTNGIGAGSTKSMPTTLGLVDRAGPFPGPANGFRNRSSNDDAQVNVLADEDLSTGTSLAEEEVEAVLSSSPSLKRKLSVSESPRRIRPGF